uniref:Uncharacterized protein n=1 Tax=Arundo donax TaxID=35708 RepID=A0A0A9GTZ5_ARUDO
MSKNVSHQLKRQANVVIVAINMKVIEIKVKASPLNMNAINMKVIEIKVIASPLNINSKNIRQKTFKKNSAR